MMVLHACIVLIGACRYPMSTSQQQRRASLLLKEVHGVFASDEAMRNDFAARHVTLLGKILETSRQTQAQEAVDDVQAQRPPSGKRAVFYKVSRFPFLHCRRTPFFVVDERTRTSSATHGIHLGTSYLSDAINMFDVQGSNQMNLEMFLNDISLFAGLNLPSA